MTTTYSYSATKTDGKFYGAVYASTPGSLSQPAGSEQIATIDGIRTIRGVKSFTKAAAQLHRKENRPADSHNENHYVNGQVNL